MTRFRFVLLLLLLAALASLALFSPLSALWQPEQPAPDWRFGIVETYEDPDKATEAGAAWTRVRFLWHEVWAEGPDSWNPPISDRQLGRELEDDRLVVGLLVGIPDWARDEDGLPQGLRQDPSDPANLWATYVRQIVDHYRGRIDHWVIWNEPDIWDEDALGHTWPGELEDFARLQQVAYLVAKETNPDVVIHLAAFTYFWDANYGREQYFARLLDHFAADPQAPAHNYYFDVATAHLYFQPALIYDLLLLFQEIMAGHGLEKPIWLMETNAPPSDDPTWPASDYLFQVELYEQAAFIPQALSLALAAGAERVAIYKLHDLETDLVANPEPFGLLRRDGSRRPAYDTYRVAARYLAGARAAVRLRWDEVGQVRLDQGPFTTDVLFARLPGPQTVTVEATGTEAVLVDMWGEQRTLQAEGGSFTVELPGSACAHSVGDYCMIGGTTYYLVQAAPGGKLPERLPAPRHSPTVSPSTSPVADAVAPSSPVADSAKRLVQPAPVEANQATVSFPDSVTFTLETAPASDIEEIILTYDVVHRSCVDVSSQVPLMPEGDVVEWTWVMSRSGNPPPGAEIWWEWTLVDAAGGSTTTPRQSLILEDDRFSWQTVSAEEIALHWYEGEEIGPLLLDAALAGRRRLEEEMGITLEDDVTFYIYEDAADMREAVLYSQEWAGGLAFSEYNTILIGVPPAEAEGWGRETVRHELAHLLLGGFAWSCLGGSRPTWLEEGLAVYAEGPANEETLADIQRGKEEGAFLPLRSLNGAFPTHSSEASMAYSQSYSVVAFLLDTYGQERLQQLLLTLAGGQGYDEALGTVYGFNVDQLETEWRTAIGAPPRPIPPTATPLRANAVPTVAPMTAAEDLPTPTGMEQTPPAPAGETGPGLCASGLLPLLLLGLIGWRRRSPTRE